MQLGRGTPGRTPCTVNGCQLEGPLSVVHCWARRYIITDVGTLWLPFIGSGFSQRRDEMKRPADVARSAARAVPWQYKYS